MNLLKLPQFEKYSLKWPTTIEPVRMEVEMVRHGGRWKKQNGTIAGEGMEFHFKSLMSLLWPWIKWHNWAELQLKCYLNYRIIGQIGSASSGKSFVSAACVLTDYYCYPSCTTVLVSSTTRESLEMRVWGEIKKLHKSARALHDWLPGHLIEGKQRIVSDPRSEAEEGRDFRNGIVGVACKRGQAFQGMEEYVGIKNKRLRMLADELQFLPRQFVDSISNMNKNADFKCVGSGNPKDTTDALGVLCEPAAVLGGWDGGIDQTSVTKTWELRFPRGICIQLPGSDSPNLNGQLGIPLITQEQIDYDIKFYGKDSIQYTMMDEGRMPKGQGSRRVITRQLCLKHGAMEDPIWLNNTRTRLGCLDAAYRGVGGDRCVFMELQFGMSSENQSIIALVDQMVIPITGEVTESPEDQIAIKVRDECERRGIPPEHFGFDSTGRGSLMGAFGRLWSPQVIPVEFGGSPTERPVSNGIDVLCKNYYSKFVTELWYSVRLVIECGQFRGMTEDVMMEGCSREWTFVGNNKIEVEPKDKMKLKCFVAGTMVKTPNGEKPIESISAGELVSTPLGPSPVMASHKNKSSELSRAVFSDGTSITGESSHKVFTWNRGFVPLGELQLTDKLEWSRVQVIWQLLSEFFTVETGITFHQMANTISEGGEGAATRSDLYTEPCSTMLRDACQTAGTFITKMGILTTTITRTLNFVWSLITARIMPSIGGQISASVCSMRLGGLVERCVCGINPHKEKNGIAHRPKSCGTTKSQDSSNAKYVEEAFMPLASKLPGSVQSGAITDIGGKKAGWKRVARFAERIFSLALLTRQRPARLIAVQSLDGPEQDVYDLTLLDHNVYYANGILVSNCGRSPDLFDSLVTGVEVARRLGFKIKVVVNTPGGTRGDKWKQDLRDQAKALWSDHQLSYK